MNGDAAPLLLQRSRPLPARVLLLCEGLSFVIAALTHFGVLFEGYAHRQASIAESVIAVVLLAGLGGTWVWPARTRLISLIVQAFALLGTLVGGFTIMIGVGPRMLPEGIYHLAILALLVCGLVFAAKGDQRQ